MRFLAALLCFLTVGFGANIASANLINGCNFAPYPINLRWIVPETGQSGRMPLAAGECNTIRQSSSGSASLNTRLFAEPISSRSYNYIRYKSWYAKFWDDLGIKNPQWPSAQSGGLIYCASTTHNTVSRANRSNTCPAGTETQFYSAPLNFENGRADWVVLDFALCDRLTDLDCYGSPTLDELALWATEMSNALERLYAFHNPSPGYAGLIPTMPGVVLKDTNRMFNQGVEVISAADATPFGTPIQLQPGDEILFFNGHKIFGQDINILLYEAGKKYGYDHANEVIFRRNGQTYATKLALYFDHHTYGSIFQTAGGRCREPLIAGALGALDEFQFYQQSKLSCMLDDIKKPGTINQTQCRFERDQFIAAIKQFCPQANFVGRLFGGLTFPARSVVERLIPIKGKSLYSRATRALIMEVAEESARALLTQPPGVNTKAVIDDIIARGKLQGAIGVGFQVAPRVTGLLLIPMIYNSYPSQ